MSEFLSAFTPAQVHMEVWDRERALASTATARLRRFRAQREQVRTDAIMDGSFLRERVRAEVAGERARHTVDAARARAASAGSGGRGLGLVYNETTSAGCVVSHTACHAVRRTGVRVEIDGALKRVKRLRTSLEHASRLLHFDAHDEAAPARWQKKMLTMTYRPGVDWSPEHMAHWSNMFRTWCRRRSVKCRYVWVAELQVRGVVHYHIVIWVQRGVFLPQSDRNGWWPHGSTRTETVQSPMSYIMKYATKTDASNIGGFPKGCRLHGAAGLTREHRRHLRYWRAPFWVRDSLTGRADIRKVVGGYMDAYTGELVLSPWSVTVDDRGRVFAVQTSIH